MGINSIGHQKTILREISNLSEDGKLKGRDDRVIKLAIEGNIAAGKSTFLTILEKEINFHVVQGNFSSFVLIFSLSTLSSLCWSSEPVSKWQKVGGKDGDKGSQNGANLLGMFYENPNRWAYAFQTFAFVSRIHLQLQSLSMYKHPSVLKSNLENTMEPPQTPRTKYGFGGPSSDESGRESPTSELSELGSELGSPMSSTMSSNSMGATPTPKSSMGSPSSPFSASPIQAPKEEDQSIIQFFERSVYSDRYCFAYNGYKAGLLQPVEYNLYCDWHTWMVQSFPQLELDGIVYLRSEPETCYQRLQKRARSEESSIPLSYLQSVHERHEEWLVEGVHKDPIAAAIDHLPTLQLQVDDDFLDDKKRQAKLIEDMHVFVGKIRDRRALSNFKRSPMGGQLRKHVSVDDARREGMQRLEF